MILRRRPRALFPSLLLAGAWTCVAACDPPPVVRNCNLDAAVQCPNDNQPAGRIEGTVIYQGPPPPMSMVTGREGLAAGRVILLLFDANNPPPPDGTATTAVSFQTVSAPELFQNAQVLPNGQVRATLPYVFPNVTQGGVYQIRAFYSHLEQITFDPGTGASPITSQSGFHPLYDVRNEPVQGDVGGGAIVDPTAAIPQFTNIVVGVPSSTNDAGQVQYTIPDDGVVVPNITVFLGKVFDTERPIFHVLTDPGTTAPSNLTLGAVPPPPTAVDPMSGLPTPGLSLIDYAKQTGLMPPGSPQLTIVRNYVVQHTDTGSDLPTFSIAASLPRGTNDECVTAALAGVLCPNDPASAIGFFERAYDRDRDGVINFSINGMPPFGDAHPTLLTTSPLDATHQGHLPWLYPLVIFSKLHDPTADEATELANGVGGAMTPQLYAQLQASLNQPESLDPANGRFPVFLFGTVLPSGSAASLLLHPWASGYQATENPVRVALIPVAVEVHGPNPATDWWVIVPPSVPALATLAQPFLPGHYCCWDYDPYWDMYGFDFPDQAGVPVGRYAINVINHNGQTWTIPNDLGNVPNASCAGGVCSATSQTMVLRTLPAVAPTVPVACPSPEEMGNACRHE